MVQTEAAQVEESCTQVLLPEEQLETGKEEVAAPTNTPVQEDAADVSSEEKKAEEPAVVAISAEGIAGEVAIAGEETKKDIVLPASTSTEEPPMVQEPSLEPAAAKETSPRTKRASPEVEESESKVQKSEPTGEANQEAAIPSL